jgi:predicted transcriptional regulator
MKYRSRIEIITMILESARTGASKTKIMYKSYLSYSQLVDYLKILETNRLLTYEEGRQLYKITEKGNKFLNASSEINDLMKTKN